MPACLRCLKVQQEEVSAIGAALPMPRSEINKSYNTRERPLIYKTASQQDDLALVGIERQPILAPAYQAPDGPLEVGDRYGVQQGEVNEVK